MRGMKTLRFFSFGHRRRSDNTDNSSCSDSAPVLEIEVPRNATTGKNKTTSWIQDDITTDPDPIFVSERPQPDLQIELEAQQEEIFQILSSPSLTLSQSVDTEKQRPTNNNNNKIILPPKPDSSRSLNNNNNRARARATTAAAAAAAARSPPGTRPSKGLLESRGEEVSFDRSESLRSATISQISEPEIWPQDLDLFGSAEDTLHVFKGLERIPTKCAEVGAEIGRRVQAELDTTSETNALGVSASFVANLAELLELDTLGNEMATAANVAVQKINSKAAAASARSSKGTKNKGDLYYSLIGTESKNPHRLIALEEITDTYSLSRSGTESTPLNQRDSVQCKVRLEEFG